MKRKGSGTLGRKTLGRRRTKQDSTVWKIYGEKKKQDWVHLLADMEYPNYLSINYIQAYAKFDN